MAASKKHIKHQISKLCLPLEIQKVEIQEKK
jgi:hypothetical protein